MGYDFECSEWEMISSQRLLNAMNHQPVDHVPLLLRFWSLGGDEDHIPFNWRDEVNRVEATTALGLDDTLLLQPPLGYVEEYIPEKLTGVTSFGEYLPQEAGEQYPLFKKVYETPTGSLQTILRITPDWPRGDDIHLFDDYNLSRLKEPLIKNNADIDRLKYLLTDPSKEQLEDFNKLAAELRGHADRLGVLLDGGWVALGDALMWLCGMERVLYGQMDEPELLDQVLEVIFEWEMRRIDLLIAAGIDELVHMAWYETNDFWTPKNWRRFLKPRLAKEIEKAHQHGVKFRYIITKSWKSYWMDFLEMGVDCITGVDPVQDQLNLKEVKRAIGDRICLMGGVNSAVMLSQWSNEQIRQAVRDAIEILAPSSGFILYPVDAIFNIQSWEKVEVLIDEWRKSYR